MDGKLLKTILSRQGYSIAPAFGKRTIASSFDDTGEVSHLEPSVGYESLCEKKLALNYTGKCVVRIKFYRHRLADYSRANCEKAIIDSIQYAGLISGDSEKEIRLIDEGQEKIGKGEEERVELTLEYEDVDFDNLWVKAKSHKGR